MTAYRDRLNAGHYAPKKPSTETTVDDALEANRVVLEKLSAPTTAAKKPAAKRK